MNDHLTPEMIECYKSRSLSASELLIIDGHLSECQDCRALAGATPPSEAVIRLRSALLGAPVHVSELELERAASGQSTDQEAERIRLHTEHCEHCRMALDDLCRTQAAIELGSMDVVRPMRRQTSRVTWGFAVATPVAVAALFVGILYGSRQASRQTADLEQSLQTARRQTASATQSLHRATIAASKAQAAASAAEIRERQATEMSQRLRREIAALRSSAGRSQNPISPTTIAMASDPDLVMAEVRLSLGQFPTSGARTRGSEGPIRPVRETVISVTPLLEWTDARTDCAYRVEVIKHDEVVASGVVPPGTREWRVAPPLARGIMYAWDVKRISGSGIEMPWTSGNARAMFRVLDRDRANAVLNARILAALESARAGSISEARADLLQIALDGEDLPVSERARSLAKTISAATKAHHTKTDRAEE